MPEPNDLRLDRRAVLSTAAAVLAGPLFDCSTEASASEWGIPGPYPGRVVEVLHPGSVVRGDVRRTAIREMVARGLTELTGAETEASAWKRFFAPGDRVGIKVSPVGRPRSISHPETIHEVIRGLQLAGVRSRDIVLFNRYRSEFLDCGLHRHLPDGVRWECASRNFDRVQTGLAGYDPNVFVELERVMTGLDPRKALNRRSHLCTVVSRKVDKVVNISALKDHASAGLTMALKNMSHGFVNNVCRSHASAANNWCDTFIPSVVRMPAIRRKVVLQIGDGLVGTYDGGPGRWNPHFRTWEYRSLFFSTDPVAMDRVAWEILDRKRAAAGLPKLAETGRRAKNPGHERFDRRQPEHVELAAAAGLGVADLAMIDHRRLRL